MICRLFRDDLPERLEIVFVDFSLAIFFPSIDEACFPGLPKTFRDTVDSAPRDPQIPRNSCRRPAFRQIHHD